MSQLLNFTILEECENVNRLINGYEWSKIACFYSLPSIKIGKC